MDRGRTEPQFDESGIYPARVYLYRLRSVLRQRWTDYVLLTVLVSVVGGLAMGSVVAGRRTQSAYGAFLGRDDASTLTMSTYGLYNGSPANNYSPQVEQQIRRLPDVAQVESWVETYIAPLAPNGAPNLAAFSSFDVAGSVDGVFFHEDRVTVIRGRMADPANPHEFMASASGARALGIHLGQTMEFGRFDAKSSSGPGLGTPEDRPAARFSLRLVAIIEFNNSVVQDDTDRTPTNLILTPALTRTEDNYANGTWFAIRLKPGVKNVGRAEQELLQNLPPGALGQFYLTSTVEAKVESALRPESIALGVFGLIAALAVLGLCLPIMARLRQNSREERRVLRALGASRTMVTADYSVGVAASVLLGSALACVVSAALGSFAPLGPVHTVYHPGVFTVDWTVTGVGIAVLAGILCAAAVVMGVRRAIPRRARGGASRPPAVSSAVGVAAAAGLPASVVVGARFALEQGHGRTSVAARSVLAGGILSVTLVVATLTFASGLRTLVNHPALYGWDWGYTLIGNSNIPPDALSALQRDPSVQAWAGYIAVTTTVDGRSVPVLIATNSLAVTPPLVAGHQINNTGQILLGRATLTALNKRVGDTVRVGLGGPGTAPLYLPPNR